MLTYFLTDFKGVLSKNTSLLGEKFIEHTDEPTKGFRVRQLNVFDSPSQSPYSNPTEHVFKLKDDLKGGTPLN